MCFKGFLSNVDFFHGQLYGCQVTINSIYGLDMVAKKYLWWATRVFLNFQKELRSHLTVLMTDLQIVLNSKL